MTTKSNDRQHRLPLILGITTLAANSGRLFRQELPKSLYSAAVSFQTSVMRTAVRFRMWRLNSSISRKELGLRTRRVWISVLISGCREVLISIILFLYKKRWSSSGGKTPEPQRLFFQIQNAEVIAHFFKDKKFFLKRRFFFQPAHSVTFGRTAFQNRFNQL